LFICQNNISKVKDDIKIDAIRYEIKFYENNSYQQDIITEHCVSIDISYVNVIKRFIKN